MKAKVAVICLCYNHERYVQEALQSVLEQTYPTELIVVDDASTDNSVKRIQEFVNSNSDKKIRTLFYDENVGNCKAFNRALELTDADYVIDLAADDILLARRVEAGVRDMESDLENAINFTNAHYINEKGKFIRSHYEVDREGHSILSVPEGDLFQYVLEKYLICSPTMMYKASFLREVGGYDENLAYEDFDIILRLSRIYPFSYTDAILVEKRIVSSSMSTKQYKKDSAQLASTLKICRKVLGMIKNRQEKIALLKRIIYEAKQAFVNKRFLLFYAFITLGLKTILQK